MKYQSLTTTFLHGRLGEAQDRLKDVDKVEASSRAFATILRDETVVAWGDAEWGGHLLPLGILW